MEELKRLHENIGKLIDAEYPDEAFDDLVDMSSDLDDLNVNIEDELSYMVDCGDE